MRKLISVLMICLLLTGGCSVGKNGARGPADRDLTVSAAVSLREAFGELGRLYKTRTGGRVTFNFGSSGALQRQIETGAPVDLYASAGEREMDELERQGLVDPQTRTAFASNRLVLIVPPENESKVEDFQDLARADVRKIAVGNPSTVPAGLYAGEALRKMGLSEKVAAKLILAEDVRQVLDYVARGEVDAGVVYASDALVREGRVRVVRVAPEDSHTKILYPLAIVADSSRKKTAREFSELVEGPEGRRILLKYGFSTPEDK